mgnify:FL=1
MTYNFDEVIERRGTDSVKWDGVKSVWGRDDLLPMWVADMDFRTPPFVMEALRSVLNMKCWAIRLRVRNGILPFVAGSVVATVGTSLARC